MAQLYDILKPENTYFDRRYFQTSTDYKLALEASTTVYVGNLSFYASEDSLQELFSMAGKITKIIMGINDQGYPCGFCFVIYQLKEQAAKAVEFISSSKLDDRLIRVDWDAGYVKGRQKGRGFGGQQRRQDFRTKNDVERPRKNPVFERKNGQYNQRQRTRSPRVTDRQRLDQNPNRNGKQFQTDRDSSNRNYRNDRAEKRYGDKTNRKFKYQNVIEQDYVVPSTKKDLQVMIDETDY